jgi:hypothetical protein
LFERCGIALVFPIHCDYGGLLLLTLLLFVVVLHVTLRCVPFVALRCCCCLLRCCYVYSVITVSCGCIPCSVVAVVVVVVCLLLCNSLVTLLLFIVDVHHRSWSVFVG